MKGRSRRGAPWFWRKGLRWRTTTAAAAIASASAASASATATATPAPTPAPTSVTIISSGLIATRCRRARGWRTPAAFLATGTLSTIRSRRATP